MLLLRFCVCLSMAFDCVAASFLFVFVLTVIVAGVNVSCVFFCSFCSGIDHKQRIETKEKKELNTTRVSKQKRKQIHLQQRKEDV